MSIEKLHDGFNDVAKLLPRAYQDEIFAKARQANIIAALDTGSGKTLISSLVIKSVCARASSIGKKVVFLVPKVPLVEQQRSFLESQTPLRVKGYCGAMNVDAWDKSQWTNEFELADVLVMTAQIFYNILIHAFWRIEKVSLLVFDECHHAQRNHPYNAIMHDFYRPCAQELRPQIFGMTASPIWNLNKPLESLRQLEQNLFCSVVAVKDNSDDLARHSPKPIEILRLYAQSPLSYPAYIHPSLWDRLKEYQNKAEDMSKSAKSRYCVSLEAVGPYGADKYLYDYLSTKLRALVELEHNEILKQSLSTTANDMIIDQESTETSLPTSKLSTDWLRSLLREYDSHLSRECEIHSHWLSPKLLAVVNILEKNRSPSFQGIIFVEQRQLAMVISWLLPRLTALKDWIRCADLVGHGQSAADEDYIKGMNIKSQQDVVSSFRQRHFNLLVATSVAEEGLDFPACEIVIRYDIPKHIVGYLQSRGRARHSASKFFVLVEEENETEISQYMKFRQSEPGLKVIYQNGSSKLSSEDVDDEDNNEDLNPDDISERELYTIASSGATLSYGSSIGIINHLCSLIPRDRFTPVLKPKYTGDFEVILELPSALPLKINQRIYQGLPKRTKKEAKRSAAFIAAKELHRLGVLDDNLSPLKATKGKEIEDADGRSIPDISELPNLIETYVRDPWTYTSDLWLHVISIEVDGNLSAGLVTSSRLPSLEFVVSGITVALKETIPIVFDEYEKEEQIILMDNFTKLGLWWCVTSTPIDARLSCHLVPFDEAAKQPDWETMERALSNAKTQGNYCWDGILNTDADKLMIMNNKTHGQTLLLRSIRYDLTSQSRPDAGSNIDNTRFQTYENYFVDKYSKNNVKIELPIKGPLLEVCKVKKCRSARYFPSSISPQGSEISSPTVGPKFLVPQAFCKWLFFPKELFQTFQILPQLCHRATDVYRVQCACRELGLSLSLANDYLIEAFTLPCANAGFNNQRLETLGDSVLKLCVVVHLYNEFPLKHEGQLDKIKKNCISNRVLLARARSIGLEHYLTSETQDLRSWRYIIQTEDVMEQGGGNVRRTLPRRSLQDCMESALGASYLSGGIGMALHTGTALGLSFGGTKTWDIRYGKPSASPVAPLFQSLQASFGYTFCNGNLLLEAMTHPSFDSSIVSCYQRLEFLGDAVLELIVTDYLYAKFPQANSGRLSSIRAKAVCGPTLAAVAVKEFSLHKYLLTNNLALDKAVAQEIDNFVGSDYEQFVRKGWRFDPPKVLSDIFESLLGAVLVDSGYDYAVTTSVVRRAMQKVLEALTLDLPLDPVSELLIWAAKAGCRKIHFLKSRSSELLQHNDSFSIYVHDQLVAKSGTAPNLSFAKGSAASYALSVLSDPTSKHSLFSICNCIHIEVISSPIDDQEQNIDDETDEGFAYLAKSHLEGKVEHADFVTDVDINVEEE